MNLAEMMGIDDEPEDWREVNDGQFSVAFMLLWNALGEVAFQWRITSLIDGKRWSPSEPGLRLVAKLREAVEPFVHMQLTTQTREQLRQAVLGQLQRLASQRYLHKLAEGRWHP